MKKNITLSVATLVAIGQMSAAKVAHRAISHESVNPTSIEQLATRIAPENMSKGTDAVTLKTKSAVELLSVPTVFGADETITSRADDATSENDITPAYLTPYGSFYLSLNIDYQDNGVQHSEVYNSGFGLLVPANTETTWLDVTMITDGDKIRLLRDADASWEYKSFYQYPERAFAETLTSNDKDLKFKSFPTVLLANATDVPTVTSSGAEYTELTRSYSQSGYTTSTLQMRVGGGIAPNPGFAEYIKSGLDVDSVYMQSWLANPNGRYAWNRSAHILYNQNMVVGSQEPENGLWARTGNEILDMMYGDELKSIMSENELAETPSLYGFAQSFVTGATTPLLHSISLPCYIYSDGDEAVTIELYEVSSITEGEDTYTVYELVGSYDYEITDKCLPIDGNYLNPTTVCVQTIDEENDREYLVLKENTTYLLMVTGIDQFKSFTPACIREGMTNKDFAYTSQLIKNTFLGTDIFAVFNAGEYGWAMLDASYNYWNQEFTQFTSINSMSWQLGIEYPYISPCLYQDTDGAKLIDAEAEVVEGKFVPINVGESSIDAMIIAFVSDNSAEDLTATIEYSSSELKDLLSLQISEDEGQNGGNYVWTSAVRTLSAIPTGDIPAGSWIKLHNKTASMTINLPAHELSGIGDVVADGEAIATEYFDLQGRKLAGEANGIVIKKMTMADGSVKTVKVVK